MTTKNLAIPAYQLHKASGQARVQVNGKDHYLGLHDSTESQTKYRLLIASWLQNGGRFPPAGHRLAQSSCAWSTSPAAGNNGPATFGTLRSRCRRPSTMAPRGSNPSIM